MRLMAAMRQELASRLGNRHERRISSQISAGEVGGRLATTETGRVALLTARRGPAALGLAGNTTEGEWAATNQTIQAGREGGRARSRALVPTRLEEMLA